jgi:hypothetical protein
MNYKQDWNNYLLLKEYLLFENKNEDISKNLLKKYNKSNDYQELLKITKNKSPNNKHLPIITKYYLEGTPLDTLQYYFDKYINNTKINQKPIDNLSFQEFEQLVDSAVETINIPDGEITDPPIYEDENVKIFAGTTKEQCIKYGQKRKYGFCISRQDSSNLFHGYRSKGATFYFIYFKNEKAQANAPTDLIVIHAYENKFQINYSKPNQDYTKSKEQILKEFPVLQPFFNKVIKHEKHSEKEQKIYQEINNKQSILEFKNVNDQLLWVEIGKNIKNNEWKSLKNPEIILDKYIEVGSYDVPKEILDQYPKYKNRYWQKIQQRYEIKTENNLDLTNDEKYYEIDKKFKAGEEVSFKDAARLGHTEIVELLLEKGADVHANNDEALRWASENGHLEVVKLLLENGADVHANNDEALRWASENGHLEVVKLLLENGADVHANNEYALRWASENGHIEIVKLLIEKGADVHADNEYALRYASYNGHLEVVKLLLEKGSDVHAEDDWALRWASENGHLEIVKLLKSYMNKSQNINESFRLKLKNIFK